MNNATWTAIKWFGKWEMGNKPVDEIGHPKLSEDAYVVVVKVLLPRIDPNGN